MPKARPRKSSASRERRPRQAILASELSYRRLFEAAHDGILILDADTGSISDVNPFLSEMLGYSHHELIGRPIWDLGPFRDIVFNRSKFKQLQETGYIRYENLPLEARDGSKIAVEFVSNVYQAGDRSVIQCNIRNIAERKRAEDRIGALNAELEQSSAERQRLETQFIESQKMEVIGQLAAGIAHDFNNILAVIIGNSEMISFDLSPDSPLKKYNEEIKHASEYAAGLTRQLLIFSRKQPAQPVVLDLNDVVRDMENLLRRLIGENILITILPAKRASLVKADASHVAQVLMNLVVNARDAMANGGRLTISVDRVTLDKAYALSHPEAAPGFYWMLSVSDTGTGITEAVKARLFEPLFTTKPLGKGTGLGLATCQTIVQQSGGHIGVFSEIGKGSTFKVYFPRVQEAAKQTATNKSGPLPRGSETLLIVEDHSSVRLLIRRALESLGYRVLIACNGQEALSVVQEHLGPPIALVITDVMMPVMDGKIMAEKLSQRNPGIKILFTSGYTGEALTYDGAPESGVEFIAKPYGPGALARKVRALLDR